MIMNVVKKGNERRANLLFVMQQIGPSGSSLIVNNGKKITSTIKSWNPMDPTDPCVLTKKNEH